MKISPKQVYLFPGTVEETILVQSGGVQRICHDAENNQIVLSIEEITDIEVNYQFTDVSDDDDGDGFSTCDGDCNDAISGCSQGNLMPIITMHVRRRSRWF